MTDQDANRVSAREAFEYACRGFVEALEILARDPAEQVLLNGSYHTPVEVLFDVIAGHYLLISRASYLSGKQKAAIRDFLEEVERLPVSIDAGSEADPDLRSAANLTTMLHPCWQPIRRRASELKVVLASAILLNRGYFHSLG